MTEGTDRRRPPSPPDQGPRRLDRTPTRISAVAEVNQRAEQQRAKTNRLRTLRLARDAEQAAAEAAAPPAPRPARRRKPSTDV